MPIYNGQRIAVNKALPPCASVAQIFGIGFGAGITAAPSPPVTIVHQILPFFSCFQPSPMCTASGSITVAAPEFGAGWFGVIKDGAFHLVERAPGVSVEEIVEKTAGKLVVPDHVPEMTFEA